ncbi:hypothetical protein BDZ45DRAFT_697630 [Acephala macrosclerotiorum]|nr:hypothetical protein BDZ45DRAFT_697630 [Acephala macrosclerotiorum]
MYNNQQPWALTPLGESDIDEVSLKPQSPWPRTQARGEPRTAFIGYWVITIGCVLIGVPGAEPSRERHRWALPVSHPKNMIRDWERTETSGKAEADGRPGTDGSIACIKM